MSAIEYGHVPERHLAIGPETVPRVGWYHYDVSRFGDDVGSVDCIDASSLVYGEHLAATVAMLWRAASRWMGVHREDQIKTVIFAAENFPPACGSMSDALIGGDNGSTIRRPPMPRFLCAHTYWPIGVRAREGYRYRPSRQIDGSGAGHTRLGSATPEQRDRLGGAHTRADQGRSHLAASDSVTVQD